MDVDELKQERKDLEDMLDDLKRRIDSNDGWVSLIDLLYLIFLTDLLYEYKKMLKKEIEKKR